LCPLGLGGCAGLGLHLWLRRFFHHLIAGQQGGGLVELIVTQPNEAIARRLVMDVGDQDDLHLVPCLDVEDVGALLVEQIGADVYWGLDVDGGGILLDRLLLQHAQQV
jgi:hypothetical protein